MLLAASSWKREQVSASLGAPEGKNRENGEQRLVGGDGVFKLGNVIFVALVVCARGNLPVRGGGNVEMEEGGQITGGSLERATAIA